MSAAPRARVRRHHTFKRSRGEILTHRIRLLEEADNQFEFLVAVGRQSRYRVNGLDISRTFVDIARKNADQAKVSVDFRQGNVADMPFKADRFDLVVCRAAFKNFSQPVKALTEMWRVLKSGGRALIIDLRRDVSPKTVNRYVDQLGVGGFQFHHDEADLPLHADQARPHQGTVH